MRVPARTVSSVLLSFQGEPNEAQLRENRIIDELKSFAVYPKHGTLAPGQGVAVTLSYKHDSLEYDGQHQLAVHVKVLGQNKVYKKGHREGIHRKHIQDFSRYRKCKPFFCLFFFKNSKIWSLLAYV